MKKLVFATNNRHKIEEVRNVLRSFGEEIASRFEILSLSDIGCHDDIPETASTFAGNALQKAEYVKVHYGYDCFADDSGLEVRALGMEPGVYSARYANDEGYDHDSAANMDKLLRRMSHITSDRSAQFRTVIVLMLDGNTVEFEGVCRGEITAERHGDGGFGYDPIFRPQGHTETFAEMSLDQKNTMSHRALAVGELVSYLKELPA
ncbi:MAG: RdgB/HAM1 family non-canonical purine NTP pyrophosphatase [Bacteroidales bacterium]|nr:RdgB/HAM1 family non-canonical purine NTP pyrophosphatase [Candidatus Liminaster caballi]